MTGCPTRSRVAVLGKRNARRGLESRRAFHRSSKEDACGNTTKPGHIVSAKGQAYVEANSPYSGTTYLIHLRFGMLENETHGHLLYMGDVKFAELCRCSTKTVQRAREQMINDGFLRMDKPAAKGHKAEYEFLFPDPSILGGQIVQANESLGGHPDRLDGHPVQVGWTSEESSPLIRIKENSKRLPVGSSTDADFEQFWIAYPRKVHKTTAKASYQRVIRRGARAAELRRAAANYASFRAAEISLEPEKGQRFTKHPSTFLNDGTWRDYLDDADVTGVAEREEMVQVGDSLVPRRLITEEERRFAEIAAARESRAPMPDELRELVGRGRVKS